MFGVGRGVPVYGVVSHDAIALAELQGPLDAAAGAPVATNAGENQNLLVLTDARRKEVYWARYTDGKRVSEPAVNFPADVSGATIHSDLFPDMKALVQLTGDISEPIYLRRPDAVATADRS